MNINTECNHCGTILESSQECMGKSYHCPNCDKIVKVPKTLDEHLKIIKRVKSAERVEKENEFVNLVIKGFISSFKWIVGIVIVIGIVICGIMIANNRVEMIVVLFFMTLIVVTIVGACSYCSNLNPPVIPIEEIDEVLVDHQYFLIDRRQVLMNTKLSDLTPNEIMTLKNCGLLE